MQSFSALTLFAVLAVVASRTPINPLETVSARCFGQASPHLRELHLSMHAHRQRVHEQCRSEQASLSARLHQQTLSVQQSLEECLQSARNLAPEQPTAAAELEVSCYEAADRVGHSMAGFVNESASLHEACAFRLEHVDNEMRASSSRLFHVLARCAPQHACVLLRMSQLKVTRLSQQIASMANLNAERACAVASERLSHGLHRACERYAVTRAIVEDASGNVYRSLHASLAQHCDSQDESIQTTTTAAPAPIIETELGPEMPLFPAETYTGGEEELLGGIEQEIRAEVPTVDEVSPYYAGDLVHDVALLGTEVDEETPTPTTGEEEEETIPYGDDMVHEVHQLVTEVYEEMPTTGEEEEETIPYGDDMVHEVHQLVTEVYDQMPTEHLGEELPSEELPSNLAELIPEIIHEMPSLPVEGNGDWNPLFGIGPVRIDDTMPAGQGANGEQEIGDIGQAVADDVDMEDDSNSDSDSNERSDRPDAHGVTDKHHSRRHGHKLIVLAVATGFVCLVVCVVAAAVATKVLRRRHRNAIPQQPEKSGDVVKRALLDDDSEIRQIEQKGFENPTYKHFELLEEEV